MKNLYNAEIRAGWHSNLVWGKIVLIVSELITCNISEDILEVTAESGPQQTAQLIDEYIKHYDFN